MLDSTQLFQHGPTSVLPAIETVFRIFAEHWKPLTKLAGIQIVAFIVVIGILGVITVVFAAAYVAAMVAVVRNINNNGAGRYLLDFTIGSGSSRLLNNVYYDSLDVDDDDFDFDQISQLFDAKFVAIVFLIYITWLVVLSVVGSIFAGAFCHAIAEVYAGNTPSPSKSLSRGGSRVWSVFLYQLLFGLIVTGIFLLTVVLPIGIEMPDFKNIGLIFLGVLVFIACLIYFPSVMVAATPSIVVEGQTSLRALERSWQLCKGNVGFIFCSKFCFSVVSFIVQLILNVFLGYLPDVLTGIGHLLVQVVLMSVVPT